MSYFVLHFRITRSESSVFFSLFYFILYSHCQSNNIVRYSIIICDHTLITILNKNWLDCTAHTMTTIRFSLHSSRFLTMLCLTITIKIDKNERNEWTETQKMKQKEKSLVFFFKLYVEFYIYKYAIKCVSISDKIFSICTHIWQFCRLTRHRWHCCRCLSLWFFLLLSFYFKLLSKVQGVFKWLLHEIDRCIAITYVLHS